MFNGDDSWIGFGLFRNLNGSVDAVPLGRRNGKLIPLFTPTWISDDEENPLEEEESWMDQSKYYVNLNPVETRTWRQILNGNSISQIARNEKVSRQAIYSRINGMIGKNFWVLLWWRLRQEKNHEHF